MVVDREKLLKLFSLNPALADDFIIELRELVADNQFIQIDLSFTGLSEAEKHEHLILVLEELQRLSDGDADLYKEYSKIAKVSGRHEIVIDCYNRTKSVYKCQEELEKNGVMISKSQIYNILRRYRILGKRK